ncbi:NAD(P)H-flavin reductase [Nitrincola iocasae]|uniref:NAD(P)H-flavin reductase n=1 Tax=Nitrincola iocasae TaxID=2614693 RepID=A0A5J6L9H6_9GAMM|nr:NAD(P)H-flavin reductase [Nitrincola iocasae]QEW05183.1 NAD(P)H-flavin reductase [Nitrincola iocasae]
MNRYTAKIISNERLNRDVYRVRIALKASGSEPAIFSAGQYLELFLPDGRSAFFSIASAPEQADELELHIRHMPDSEMNCALVAHLEQASEVELSMAMGQCHLSAAALSTERTLVFVAGSTGFAQIKSMVEHLLANQVTQPIHVFWGGRIADDLYLDDLARQWANDYSNLHYTAVVSEPNASWLGERGLLPDIVAADIQAPAETDIYACGSPGMVYALVDALEAKGISERQIHADVFAYAPRPKATS